MYADYEIKKTLKDKILIGLAMFFLFLTILCLILGIDSTRAELKQLRLERATQCCKCCCVNSIQVEER